MGSLIAGHCRAARLRDRQRGSPAYNLLIEGRTQALDNDVVLSMKQGNVPAPSRVMDEQALSELR